MLGGLGGGVKGLMGVQGGLESGGGGGLGSEEIKGWWSQGAGGV